MADAPVETREQDKRSKVALPALMKSSMEMSDEKREEAFDSWVAERKKSVQRSDSPGATVKISEALAADMKTAEEIGKVGFAARRTENLRRYVELRFVSELEASLEQGKDFQEIKYMPALRQGLLAVKADLLDKLTVPENGKPNVDGAVRALDKFAAGLNNSLGSGPTTPDSAKIQPNTYLHTAGRELKTQLELVQKDLSSVIEATVQKIQKDTVAANAVCSQSGLKATLSQEAFLKVFPNISPEIRKQIGLGQ